MGISSIVRTGLVCEEFFLKFNVTYMGGMANMNYQRDWLLLIAYGLQDLGHGAVISHNKLDSGATINVICHGVHNLSSEQTHSIINSNVNYGVIPGEIIIDGTVNNRSQSDTDFNGNYLPYLKNADFIWCVMEHNMKELPEYGVNPSGFLKCGFHPRLQEIKLLSDEHRDNDVYFFGLLTEGRRSILRTIQKKGLRIALHDYDSPTLSFIRNSYINRSRIVLNLVQEIGFRHISGIRITYLATNCCYGLCEYVDIDDGDYLKFSDVANPNEIAERCLEVIETKAYLSLAEEKHEMIRKFPMRNYLEELLDKTFGSG